MEGPRRSWRVDVIRRGKEALRSTPTDEVVVEEPLEIRVGGRSLVVTMRTPGDDLDLARGLLFTEGFVASAADLIGAEHCFEVDEESRGNVVVVSLRDGVEASASWSNRATVMSAGCGLCGKETLDAVRVECEPIASAGPSLTDELILSLPDRLRSGQSLFDATGGLHAAGLFDRDGKRLVVKEDVGRHNAVDKVIGEAMRYRLLPLSESILVLSGRAGFELVQKARRAGIPVVCSVSAPSSLAVELARDGGQTLIGFLREEHFNVYAGSHRFES